MYNLVFWMFASLSILSALLVIVAKNPVRAVFSLIVTFLATAVTWLILEAEFLAITLILVYVGAVMVLFLFVVMMLDINFATIQARFTRWLPIGLLLAVGLFGAITVVLHKSDFLPTDGVRLAYMEQGSNTQMLGLSIFKNYLLQFELAGAILLVAIIAAIALIFRGPQMRKIQRIASQVSVNPRDRVRLEDGK